MEDTYLEDKYLYISFEKKGKVKSIRKYAYENKTLYSSVFQDDYEWSESEDDMDHYELKEMVLYSKERGWSWKRDKHKFEKRITKFLKKKAKVKFDKVVLIKEVKEIKSNKLENN